MPKFSKRKTKPQNEDKMNDKEYAKFLMKAGMEPSAETMDRAKKKEDHEEMSEEEYEKFLIKNEMKPLGYVEEGE